MRLLPDRRGGQMARLSWRAVFLDGPLAGERLMPGDPPEQLQATTGRLGHDWLLVDYDVTPDSCGADPVVYTRVDDPPPRPGSARYRMLRTGPMGRDA